MIKPAPPLGALIVILVLPPKSKEFVAVGTVPAPVIFLNPTQLRVTPEAGKLTVAFAVVELVLNNTSLLDVPLIDNAPEIVVVRPPTNNIFVCPVTVKLANELFAAIVMEYEPFGLATPNRIFGNAVMPVPTLNPVAVEIVFTPVHESVPLVLLFHVRLVVVAALN